MMSPMPSSERAKPMASNDKSDQRFFADLA